MTTFQDVAAAWVVSFDLHNGELSRLAFWVEQFGTCPIQDVSKGC
ncbi:MAG: hypothetical protein ACI8SI_002587 [Congregibacter sp.]|jgi:hypothetical protein